MSNFGSGLWWEIVVDNVVLLELMHMSDRLPLRVKVSCGASSQNRALDKLVVGRPNKL